MNNLYVIEDTTNSSLFLLLFSYLSYMEEIKNQLKF